jgi:hypothetical protein
MPSIAGELVTETLDYDGGRQVTVYVPPDPPEAVVFAGDGQLLSQWGVVIDNQPATISEDRVSDGHPALCDRALLGSG